MHIHVLQWLLDEGQGQLPNIRFGTAKSPEIAYWLYERGRHLPVTVIVPTWLRTDHWSTIVPNYLITPDAIIEFIHWCLKVQEDEDCPFIIKGLDLVSSYAVEHGHLDILQRLQNYTPVCNDLEIAVSNGHLETAKLLHRNYCFSDRRCEWECMNLEMAQWVINGFKWKDPKARLECLMKMTIVVAAKCELDVLQFMVETQNSTLQSLTLTTRRTYDLRTDPEYFDKAAGNHRLPVIPWLHDQGYRRTYIAARNVAENGCVDNLKWLHMTRTEDFNSNAMNCAARHGDLQIIQWLHENRTKGCTSNAMDAAASNGHIDVLRWLHKNRTEGCTSNAMDQAARSGCLGIVRWLHENRTEGCTTNAMNLAALYGHLDVIRFLHTNRHGGCTSLAQENAMKNGHLVTFKWLHETRSERCSQERFLELIDQGEYLPDRLDLLEYAAYHSEYIPCNLAAEMLIDRGRCGAVDYILSSHKPSKKVCSL